MVAGNVRVSNMAKVSHTADMPTWFFFGKDDVSTMILYFWMDLAPGRTLARLNSPLPSIMKTNILSKKMCLFGELQQFYTSQYYSAFCGSEGNFVMSNVIRVTSADMVFWQVFKQ